jgi:hypothetical protein
VKSDAYKGDAMSWRSWLFPHSPAAKAEKHLREARRGAEAFVQPIGALGLAIVSASWQCAQAVKPYLRPTQEIVEKEPLLQQAYVLNEFLYFFIHLMKRHAHSQLSFEQSETLQKIILPLIVRSAAVDAFFGHWPEDLRSGIETDFYKILTEVDTEYTARTDELLAKSNSYPVPLPFAGLRTELALSSRLVLTVVELAGYEIENGRPETTAMPLASLVGSQVISILSSGGLRNFCDLVEKASAAIDSHQSTGESTLPEVLSEFWAQAQPLR